VHLPAEPIHVAGRVYRHFEMVNVDHQRVKCGKDWQNRTFTTLVHRAPHSFTPTHLKMYFWVVSSLHEKKLL